MLYTKAISSTSTICCGFVATCLYNMSKTNRPSGVWASPHTYVLITASCRSVKQFAIDRRLLLGDYIQCASWCSRFVWGSIAWSISVSRYTCIPFVLWSPKLQLALFLYAKVSFVETWLLQYWEYIIPIVALFYTVIKNDTDVAHYNFNTHKPILVIFGRDIAERICY